MKEKLLKYFSSSSYKITLIIIIISIISLILLLSYIDTIVHKNYQCSDFSTQVQAQKFFMKLPYDKYGLDKDSDGIVCESLRK